MDGFLDVVENGRLIGWDERARFEFLEGWRERNDQWGKVSCLLRN